MTRVISVLVFTVAMMTAVYAESVNWNTDIVVDDFDDSRMFVSSITATGQGRLVLRYHENTPSKYEVVWVFKQLMFSCGETGSWLKHSGWKNIEVRVDGGKVMSFMGGASTDKEAAFLKDGTDDTLDSLVKSLIGAKKVVLRAKDKCHQDGQGWVFSKYEDIVGKNYLSGIQF